MGNPRDRYRSEEYFAQSFADFLRTPTGKKPQGYRAEHHGNRVEFRVANVSCEVRFLTGKGATSSVFYLINSK